MRLITIPVLLSLAALLTACPTGQESGGRPASVGSQPEQEVSQLSDRSSLRAVDFIRSSLGSPATEDRASLEDCWHVISRLPEAGGFQREIGRQVQQAGTNPGVDLLSAWLATSPDEASEYVLEKAVAGDAAVLQALVRHPGPGIQVVSQLDITNQSVEFQDAVLLLIRLWNPQDLEDIESLLRELAHSEDPDNSLRAIGYLLRGGWASEGQRSALQAALDRDSENLAAAIEAVKISRSEEFVTELIPLVQDMPSGELDPEAPLKRYTFLAAYALAYLPGEDARVIRTRLLQSTHPDIRWMARFGELMQGNPELFSQASLESGVLDQSLLKCMTPYEAYHLELLPWYEKALEQSDERVRFQLASQLGRYNEHASDPRLRNLVLGLLDDESSLVRGQAWLLAAQFGLGGRRVEAAGLLASDTEQAPVKAAAACYLLSVPEDGQATGS